MPHSLLCLLLWLSAALAWPQLSAANGITHVAFRVGDLAASREFYRRLGFEQAFEFTDDGKTTVAFMKINDHQFIELYPRTENSQPIGLMHICFETDDVEAVRQRLVDEGLGPTPVTKGRAGNLLFSLRNSEGHVLEYLQYLPGSMHVKDRGKHLGESRISQRLIRAGDPAPRVVFEVPAIPPATAELRRRGFQPRTSRGELSITDPDGTVIVLTVSNPDSR